MYVDIKWVKLSVGWYKSDDIQLIRKLQDGDSIALMFVMLLAMAGDRNESGYIPYSEEDLSALLDMPLSTVRMALKAMESRRMIDFNDGLFHITNWDKYQSVEGMEKIKEQNRIRKQNQREREKQKALVAQQQLALPAPDDPPKEKGPTAAERRFERWYKTYPKKVGRGAAEKAFAKYKPDDQLTDTMIRAVEAQKQSRQWKEGYIPNPATWLNQKRWLDELEEEPLPFTDPPEPGYIRDESIEDWN